MEGDFLSINFHKNQAHTELHWRGAEICHSGQEMQRFPKSPRAAVHLEDNPSLFDNKQKATVLSTFHTWMVFCLAVWLASWCAAVRRRKAWPESIRASRLPCERRRSANAIWFLVYSVGPSSYRYVPNKFPAGFSPWLPSGGTLWILPSLILWCLMAEYRSL